jgi:hypothetical protein
MLDVSFYPLNDRNLFFRELVRFSLYDTNMRVTDGHASCNYSAKDALGLTWARGVLTLIS